MILKPIVALDEQPGMPEAIARVVAAASGYVCGVCGLQRMGHTPETAWLGNMPHEWSPVPATDTMIEHARELTACAYRAR